MNYFVRNSERKGTCYHEFYKGKWDGKTYWKDDSLLLDDDVLCECQGFLDAIEAVILTYDPYEDTEIDVESWRKIGKSIKEEYEESKELYKEADDWLNDVFKDYDCFTILGI